MGVKIDKHLNWDDHIDYLINKLNSRICLLKRAKTYVSYSLRQLLYNALIRLLCEYCCTVWGNTKNENLCCLLRTRKPCARLILDSSVSDNSVQHFGKLGWIPVDNIIPLRKLCIMHKVVNGTCPNYFNEYTLSVNDEHRYNTRCQQTIFYPLLSFIQNLGNVLFIGVTLDYGIH